MQHGRAVAGEARIPMLLLLGAMGVAEHTHLAGRRRAWEAQAHRQVFGVPATPPAWSRQVHAVHRAVPRPALHLHM